MCTTLSEKLTYLNLILGYDMLAQLESDMEKAKFEALPSKEIERIKNITRSNLLGAIHNPESYLISDFQRDRRSKIQTIYDIILGQHFEDCIMSLMINVGNVNMHLNYQRQSDKKSNSDEDFIVHGKAKVYMVELKTLSFKNYKKLPIKESNIKEKHDDTMIFLMNKDSQDIYILPIERIKSGPFEPFPKWNKSCMMIPKDELILYDSFNINSPELIKEKCIKIFR